MTVWLRQNTRVLALGMIPPGILALIGLLVLLLAHGTLGRIVGSVMAAAGGSLVLLLAWQMRTPRLAYDETGHLLVYLRSGGPFRVPLEIVECFLLGQAPTLLPGKQQERAETAAVVIKLSETAEAWRHQDVKPALGKWCEGYITIRGTWCEPLNVKLINRLNAQLAEASRALKQREVAS